jgi:hypothetical protein
MRVRAKKNENESAGVCGLADVVLEENFKLIHQPTHPPACPHIHRPTKPSTHPPTPTRVVKRRSNKVGCARSPQQPQQGHGSVEVTRAEKRVARKAKRQRKQRQETTSKIRQLVVVRLHSITPSVECGVTQLVWPHVGPVQRKFGLCAPSRHLTPNVVPFLGVTSCLVLGVKCLFAQWVPSSIILVGFVQALDLHDRRSSVRCVCLLKKERTQRCVCVCVCVCDWAWKRTMTARILLTSVGSSKNARDASNAASNTTDGMP